MAQLLFTCPITKGRIPTGIETKPGSLRAAWSKRLEIKCPLCGGTHAGAVRDIYCENALQDACETIVVVR